MAGTSRIRFVFAAGLLLCAVSQTRCSSLQKKRFVSALNATARLTTFSVPLKNHNNIQYYGLLRVGTPWQPFKVVFDTAALTWVPSVACKDTTEACRTRATYDASQSSSFTTIYYSVGTMFGESTLYGYMGGDRQQLGDGPITQEFFICQILDFGNGLDGYNGVPYDGVLGLYQDGLSLFDHFVKEGRIAKPWLGFYFSSKPREDGEAMFGGANERHYRGSLVFSEVEYRNWQFQLQGIQVGDTEHFCFGGCPARIAPADTFIGGPVREIERINSILGAQKNAQGEYEVNCRNIRRLPDIKFAAAGREFNLRSKEYVVEVETFAGKRCYSGFAEAPQDRAVTWHLGHPFLRNVYTVLVAPTSDSDGYGRVGFAYSR
ncbi:lysosomal aspartic protease-like [Amblyomma americanum]